MVTKTQERTAEDRPAVDAAGEVVDQLIGGDFLDRHDYLNFLDAFLGLDRYGYKASDFPADFFGRVIDRLACEPAMMAAIRAWNAEGNLLEETPPADGILGTAATEAHRMARAMSAARFSREDSE